MPLLMPPAPAAIVVSAGPQLPPLSFAGFTARMSIPRARATIAAAGGTLSCRTTSDPRLRECTGLMPFTGLSGPFRVLISSVSDSAAVIVLSATTGEKTAAQWTRSLVETFGTPNRERQAGTRESLQWIRRRQMLRLVTRGGSGKLEAAVTLTDGPLLDGLGR